MPQNALQGALLMSSDHLLLEISLDKTLNKLTATEYHQQQQQMTHSELLI